MSDMTIPLNLDECRDKITAHYNEASKSLLEIGRLLYEVKQNLPEDSTFEAFMTTLPFSRRSAYNYLRLHEHYLQHGSATVALEQLSIDVLYILPPDSKAVDKAIAKVKSGKKVTKQDAKALVKSADFGSNERNRAWEAAAEMNPQFVAESMQRGAVMDLDGQDRPLNEVDATLIEVSADQEKSESLRRQKLHIQEHADKQEPIEGIVQALQDNHGKICLGIILDYENLALIGARYYLYPVKQEKKASA